MRYTPSYFLFIALLFIADSLRAAVIREDFAQMVDYAGWQLIDAYMQDYTRLRPDMTKEKQGYELFKNTYNTTNYSLQKPPNSEAIRLFLISHEWRNAGINLYAAFVNTKAAYQNDWNDAQAAEFLQSKIDAISPEVLGAQRDADYTTLQATKERLKMQVAQSFMGSATNNTSSTGREPSTPVTETVSQEPDADANDTATLLQNDDLAAEEDEDANDVRGFVLPAEASDAGGGGSSNLLSYTLNPISLGAIALLTLFLLYLFGLLKRLDNRVDKHSKRIEDLTTRLFLKKEPAPENDIAQLRKEVTNLQEQVKKLTPVPPPAPPTKKSSIRKPTLSMQDEYYLSTPNSDGTFNVSSMSSQFRPSASVYKFLVTEANGTERAEFTVANDNDAVKDALSSPGSYLDPVCESINPYFSGAKRIVNIRPGKAVKEGDKWVVKPEHKARIRYE